MNLVEADSQIKTIGDHIMDHRMMAGAFTVTGEYIKVASEIVSEDSKAPGEARSIMRYISGKLKAEIDASLKGEMSLEQRAHLEDCSHQIDEALNPRKG